MSKLSRRSSTFTFGYILLSAALVLGACHGKKSKKGSTDGDTPCTTTAACSGTQICDPGTSKCVDTLACTTHDQCGTAAYCDTAAGQCVRSVADQQNPCSADANCAGTERCSDAGRCGCGGVPYNSSKVIPNMVVVIDRSQSMQDSPVGGDVDPTNPSKWMIAVSATKNLVNDPSFTGKIRFGLALYPSKALIQPAYKNGDCITNHEVGQLQVKPGATATEIGNTLDTATAICYGTPIGATLNDLRTTEATLWQDPTRPNYVLLMTDGEEDEGGDPVTEAGLLFTQTPSVKTYVVGFGGEVNTGLLNSIARVGVGLKENDESVTYYNASDLGTLTAAFGNIAGSSLSYAYQLPETPPDADKLYVYMTDTSNVVTKLSRDTTHANGWDYDSGTGWVTIYGSSLRTELQNGAIANVSIVYGCPIGGMGG